MSIQLNKQSKKCFNYDLLNEYFSKTINKSRLPCHSFSVTQQTGHYITFSLLEPMRTVPSVFRVQHVACPLLDGVIAARLATRRPRGPGRIVALDRFRRVPGAGSPRRIGIVPRGVTVHKAAFHFAEFPWTPVTTVRWMSLINIK